MVLPATHESGLLCHGHVCLRLPPFTVSRQNTRPGGAVCHPRTVAAMALSQVTVLFTAVNRYAAHG
jgi:hypothetical protein